MTEEELLDTDPSVSTAPVPVPMEETGVVQPIPEAATLRGERLTKIYRKRRVVSDVDIRVRQGEIVGLL